MTIQAYNVAISSYLSSLVPSQDTGKRLPYRWANTTVPVLLVGYLQWLIWTCHFAPRKLWYWCCKGALWWIVCQVMLHWPRSSPTCYLFLMHRGHKMKEVNRWQTPGRQSTVLNERVFLFLRLLNVCSYHVVFLIILLQMYTYDSVCRNMSKGIRNW